MTPLRQGLACAVLGLSACAPLPSARDGPADAAPLVFPLPPDEPRFVYERTLYSSADVVAENRTTAFRRLVTGEGAATGEGVAKPYGVAAWRGRVYVADSVAGAVQVFDVANGRFFTLGRDDAGALYTPLGLDVDDQGTAYVVDSTLKAVKVYDAQGRFLRQFGGPKMFSRPTGVAVDRAGTRAYVVDTGGVDKHEEHRVRVFDAATGAHLLDFGKRGSGEGEFNLARDAAVAPNGNVYVVDGGNFRVQEFRPDGAFVRAFGRIGRNPGQFARPREIAIDRAGNVYVSDAAFGNLQIFSAEGQLLMFIGARSERDSPARYMLPAGIAVDEDGRVYMADQYFRKVDVFRPAQLKPGEGYFARRPGAKPAAR
jgi:sugar lactone lactonase YvrE